LDAKPPKTTVWTAPSLATASIAKTAAGIMGTMRCQNVSYIDRK
jgi:hypothetical protein